MSAIPVGVGHAPPSLISPSSPIRIAGLPDSLDLTTFTAAQRNTILRREQIVTAWQRTLGQTDRGNWDNATEQFLHRLAAAEDTIITRGTLYNWNRAYQSSGRAGLVDGRWVSKAEQKDPYKDFYRELDEWWLDQNRPAKKHAYLVATAIARKTGWNIPSYGRACEHLRWLEKHHKGRVVREREGDEAFNNQCAAYTQRDYTRIVVDGKTRPMCSNDIWCVDHHVCDALVMHEGKLIRPWLTAIEDLRSRRIVGRYWAPRAPDSSNVLLALRRAIQSTGLALPLMWYADNGKDLDCYMWEGRTKWQKKHFRIDHDTDLFAGVFGLLQVKVLRAIPYNAKAKPIERWFGTFENQFGRMCRTYFGRNPQDRPEDLDDRIERGEAPTYEQFTADAEAWIDRLYHANDHSGQGMDGQTPDQVYAANLVEVRTTTEDALAICLTKTSRPVKVGRNGVQWEKRLYGQADPILAPWFGQEVQLRVDPDDVSRVSAWTTDGRLIGELRANELAPFGATKDAEWKAATRKTARHNRQLKEVQKRGMRIVRSPLEILLEDKAAQAAAAQPPTPNHQPPTPSLKMVRTGMEDQLEALRASQRRVLKPTGTDAGGIDLLAMADDLDSGTGSQPVGIDLLSLVGGD